MALGIGRRINNFGINDLIVRRFDSCLEDDLRLGVRLVIGKRRQGEHAVPDVDNSVYSNEKVPELLEEALALLILLSSRTKFVRSVDHLPCRNVDGIDQASRSEQVVLNQ